MQLDLMRLRKRDARLFKCHFNATTKLASHFILAIEDRASLKPKDGAVERQGFDAENARAVDQGGRPIRIIAKVACHLFKDGEGTADEFVTGNGDVYEGLRPIAAEIGDLADQAVGDGDDAASGIAHDGAAEREIFHAADLVIHLNQVAYDELIFEHNEYAIDQIFDEVLRAETERQARDGGDGGNRRDVESKLGQHGENGAPEDEHHTDAVEDAGHGASLLLAQYGDAAGGFGKLNEAVGEGSQYFNKDKSNKGDYQNP